MTRNEAMMQAVVAAQAGLLPGDTAEVIACAGPPVCLLEEDEAYEAQHKGCPKCVRFVVGEELASA